METKQNQQQAVDEIVSQIKYTIMQMLNETSVEFEEMELTDDQRRIYNQFSGSFGAKVLAIHLKVAE